MRVNVVLDDGLDLDSFSERLSEKGIPVSQRLKMLNTLTADVPDHQVAEVRAMVGVRAVEPDREVHAV
jgi:hypothetical protein